VTSEFAIRPMMPPDARRLKQIIDMSFPRLSRFFATNSLHEEGEVLVSETQGIAVGFAKLVEFNMDGDKFGCVLWIAVHPDFRRKGVATALTTEGLLNLKHDGAKAVFASTQRRNDAGLNVLIRSGFRRMGFPELWRFFGWRVFQFYRDIWLAPGEVVLMHD
jgi:ribosomal protein S18 acetylase RimI-like enzyme